MTQDTLPTVAIVVLTWNQRDLTLDCLASLAKMAYPADLVQIVVDNGSSDGTAAAVHERFPDVTVLENGDNLGFAEGNNVGIRYALARGADYVMLLNNDTVVDAAMIGDLIAAAESSHEVGIVTPTIYYYDRPDYIWCAGAEIDWQTAGSRRLRAEVIDDGRDKEPNEVGFASGCAICMKRQVIEKIGLLDPRFFIYYEETDWCFRASDAGWRTLYVPHAKLWHKVSAAMGTTSPATDYYMNRNVVLFVAKHRRGFARLALLGRVMGCNLLAALAYTVKPHHGLRLPNRNARLLAFRDAVLGRWGKMGPAVASVCYPSR